MTEKGTKANVTISAFLPSQPVLIAPSPTEAIRVGRSSASGREPDPWDEELDGSDVY